jgi:flagellar motor switch/type III secretory pathway protein FliN
VIRLMLANAIAKDLAQIMTGSVRVLPHHQGRVVAIIVQLQARGDGAVVVWQNHVGVRQCR